MLTFIRFFTPGRIKMIERGVWLYQRRRPVIRGVTIGLQIYGVYQQARRELAATTETQAETQEEIQEEASA